jgi:hypothetical protein
MKVSTKDGREYEGTAAEILSAMASQPAQIAISGVLPLDTYVTTLTQLVAQLSGQTLTVTGGSGAERAASLVAELLRVGWLVECQC